jgi:hypothetical protein
VPTSELCATHDHRADRRPFQNLCEVDDGDLDAVLASLAEGSRRRFGPHYLPLRRATEARARELFVRAGGQPVRQHPHYFVLGESAWFAGLHDEPRAVTVPLAELPPEVTSFTWTDSITALGLGTHLGVPQPAEPRERGLYRLDQLDPTTTVSTGPAEDGHDDEGYPWRLLDHYVEIQLWADEPVREHLGR